MKNLKLIATIILLNLSLMSCTVDDEQEILDQNNSGDNVRIEYIQLDYEIVDLINEHRISIGLNTLKILDAASKEALQHNYYMTEQGKISHDFFYERAQKIINETNALSVSENLGYGYVSAESVVKAWLNSEGHRRNIENPNLTDIGISTITDDEGRNYFTNIFVKID